MNNKFNNNNNEQRDKVNCKSAINADNYKLKCNSRLPLKLLF